MLKTDQPGESKQKMINQTMKIDCHQHFWKYNEQDYGWMDDNMNAIKHDFLPPDLHRELQQMNFNGSVAVQARQTMEETHWLLSLADQYDYIKGVVGWLDLQSPDIEKQLDFLSGNPKLVAIRHLIQDEPDIDFMLKESFLNGISRLKQYDLTYDILVYPRHLKNAIKLVKRFPETTFVIDHIAKPRIRDQVLEPWKTYITEIAKHFNVYCKVSGMVTEADWDKWNPDTFAPYLDVIFDVFDPERIMIGSDWPVCTLAGGYKEVMNIVTGYIGCFSTREQSMILGGNALNAYRLEI